MTKQDQLTLEGELNEQRKAERKAKRAERLENLKAKGTKALKASGHGLSKAERVVVGYTGVGAKATVNATVVGAKATVRGTKTAAVATKNHVVNAVHDVQTKDEV